MKSWIQKHLSCSGRALGSLQWYLYAVPLLVGTVLSAVP